MAHTHKHSLTHTLFFVVQSRQKGGQGSGWVGGGGGRGDGMGRFLDLPVPPFPFRLAQQKKIYNIKRINIHLKNKSSRQAVRHTVTRRDHGWYGKPHTREHTHTHTHTHTHLTTPTKKI